MSLGSRNCFRCCLCCCHYLAQTRPDQSQQNQTKLNLVRLHITKPDKTNKIRPDQTMHTDHTRIDDATPDQTTWTRPHGADHTRQDYATPEWPDEIKIPPKQTSMTRPCRIKPNQTNISHVWSIPLSVDKGFCLSAVVNQAETGIIDDEQSHSLATKLT